MKAIEVYKGAGQSVVTKVAPGSNLFAGERLKWYSIQAENRNHLYAVRWTFDSKGCYVRKTYSHNCEFVDTLPNTPYANRLREVAESIQARMGNGASFFDAAYAEGV